MTTLATMKARIENELLRPDLSAEITDAIKDAINFYADEALFFNELVEVTLSVSSGAEYYDLPAGFRSFTLLTLNTPNYTYEVEPATFKYIDSMATNDNWKSRPEKYAICGPGTLGGSDRIRLYPIPNDDYTMNMSYVSDLTAVTSTCDSAWFSHGERLIRAHAKADVLENVIRGPDAVQESIVQRNREEMELTRLREKTNSRRSSGRVTPWS